MIAALDELRNVLPARFESDDYQARRRAIDEQFRSGNEEALEALSKKAQSQNIALLRTPTGFAMAPMHEGKVVKPEVFNALPEAMRRDVETKIAALEKELGQMLERLPRSDKKRRAQLSELNEEVAKSAIRDALYDLHASFSDIPEAAAYPGGGRPRHGAQRRPVPGHRRGGERHRQAVRSTPRTTRAFAATWSTSWPPTATPRRARPLVEEDNPTYGNLVGRVEHFAQMGTLVTDFLLIKPGALHKANGGYLLLDARRLLLSPFAWEALKRAIKAREVRIEQPVETAGLISTQTLDPEPIPLDVKVVLFGDRELYYLLAAHDPGLPASVQGAGRLRRHHQRARPRTTTPTPALIASVVKEHGLKPVDAAGVARVIDEGARLADDREKLSIELGRISDIVREADYWSSQAKRKITSRQDVSRAIDEQIQRADRLRDRAQETHQPRHRAARYRGRPGRPDQRPLGAAARLVLVRAAEPHHGARAPGRRAA